MENQCYRKAERQGIERKLRKILRNAKDWDSTKEDIKIALHKLLKEEQA